MPIRTWLPVTADTVIWMSSPILMVSPGRRVSKSMTASMLLGIGVRKIPTQHDPDNPTSL